MTQPAKGAIRNIAIIGAGPSSLATAKYLLAESAFSKIIIYEQRDSVGGVWNYTPLPSKQHETVNGDPNHSQSQTAIDIVTTNLPKFNTPMYEGLETNLPHTLMQYSDRPFPKGTQLFPKRETVMRYLEAYASDVMSMIKFNHQVIDVRPTSSDEWNGWEITEKTLAENETRIEKFDAVVVANGHSDWPLLPDIDALDAWSRKYPDSVHHSVSYKNPSAFKNKRTLLVGGGPSAADISQQIATVCTHPLLTAQIKKSPYHPNTQPYAHEHPTLTALLPSQCAAKFADGSVESDIDAIMLCTGYTYTFPFLTSIAPTIEEEGIAVLPLYKYIFHMQHPTLAFVEMPEMIVPFPLAESQAAVIARVWSARLSLPSSKEMREWQGGVVGERGGGRGFYSLEPPRDLEYMKEMYDWSCKAEDTAKENGETKGKMPKPWDEKACWLRMQAAEMKKAFNAKGEARAHVLDYEELGFWFGGTADGI